MNENPTRSTPTTEASAADLPWYRTITRAQWQVLIAAKLGWMLDAMDFVLYLMALTTLQHEFGYGKRTSGLVTTAALLTSAAGGIIFGLIADRFGRTRTLMVTIVLYSLCSLGTATAQSLTELIIWRSLLGFALGGEWSSGAVLVSETWPAKHRDKAMGIMQSGWAVGYLLAAVAAALVLPTLGWRWLFVVGALPALLVVWIRRAVPEPDVWLARAQAAAPTDVHPLRAIFGPALIGRTLLASLLTGTIMFGYWGLYSWLPAFLASPIEEKGAGMTVAGSLDWIIATQTGAFFGYLTFGFIADRLGRRLTFILFLLTAAVLVPIYGRMAGHPTLLLILSPLLGYFGHGYFSLFGSLMAELFPTRVRATGQGFTYGAGRALSALAPFTIGALADVYGIGPALALTSAFFLAGAGLILLLPQTHGQLSEGGS